MKKKKLKDVTIAELLAFCQSKHYCVDCELYKDIYNFGFKECVVFTYNGAECPKYVNEEIELVGNTDKLEKEKW